LLFATFLLLAFASETYGLPKERRGSACDISHANVALPAQASLVVPTSKLSYLAFGFGVQNYSCNSAGTYTDMGAVAEVFDISCLYGKPAFSTIQDDAYTAWINAPPSLTPQKIISLLHSSSNPEILGQHYFATNPLTGTGALPKWDFTSQGANKGNPDAFVIAIPSGAMAAPTGPQDVPWLTLHGIQGGLAQDILRDDSRGGVAPASCTPGSPSISVKYTNKYWLYGGST